MVQSTLSVTNDIGSNSIQFLQGAETLCSLDIMVPHVAWCDSRWELMAGSARLSPTA